MDGLWTTRFTCPIRQARSLACMSVEGFQSGSYSITLHAWTYI